MNKEKQIEEIADKMVAVCDDCNECHYGKKYGYGTCTEHQMAERIYEAGYRKAKEILQDVWNSLGDGAENDKIIIDLFKKYGVKIDE